MINKNKIPKILFIASFIFLSSGNLFAQFTYSCYDTLRQPNPYYECDKFYNPVCGCDGITYRNEDCAVEQGGLNSYALESGICGDIDVFLLDNFVSEYIEFAVYLRNFGSVNVAIYDVYGTMYYFDNISNFIEKQERQVPVQHLRHGVYFLVIFFGDVANAKKFVREPNY